MLILTCVTYLTIFLLNPYLGGGEDIYGNGALNRSNLNSIGNATVQNKNAFSLSNQFSPNFASSDSSSPGSTAPRRPPRSKHDLALSVNGCCPASPNVIRKTNGETNMSLEDTLLPSKEAPNRLLIGTQMLQSNQNSKYMSNNSSTHQTPYHHLNGVYNGQNGIQATKEIKSDKVRYIDVID